MEGNLKFVKSCTTLTYLCNDVLAREILILSTLEAPENTACRIYRKMKNHQHNFLIIYLLSLMKKPYYCHFDSCL